MWKHRNIQILPSMNILGGKLHMFYFHGSMPLKKSWFHLCLLWYSQILIFPCFFHWKDYLTKGHLNWKNLDPLLSIPKHYTKFQTLLPIEVVPNVSMLSKSSVSSSLPVWLGKKLFSFLSTIIYFNNCGCPLVRPSVRNVMLWL